MSLGGSSVSVIARGGEGGSEGGHTSPQLLLQQPTPQPPLPLPTLRVSRRMQLLLASQHLNGASARLDRDLDDFDYDSGGGDDALSVSTIDHIDDGQKGLVGTSASISYQTSSSSVWSKSDDELLKSLVLHLGRRWSSIAEIVGRSPEDVMLRYDFKIAPRRLGSWSKVCHPPVPFVNISLSKARHVVPPSLRSAPIHSSVHHICLVSRLFPLI